MSTHYHESLSVGADIAATTTCYGLKLLGHDAMDEVFRTGDLRPTQPEGHVCQMYRWIDVQRLVAAAGGDVVAASSSNWASLSHEPTIEAVAADAHRWAVFLDQEVAACAEPGALDGGTHLLFAATVQ